MWKRKNTFDGKNIPNISHFSHSAPNFYSSYWYATNVRKQAVLVSYSRYIFADHDNNLFYRERVCYICKTQTFVFTTGIFMSSFLIFTINSIALLSLILDFLPKETKKCLLIKIYQITLLQLFMSFLWSWSWTRNTIAAAFLVFFLLLSTLWKLLMF